jgi:DDE_Tnp_1-associated/Transposase DDE domain
MNVAAGNLLAMLAQIPDSRVRQGRRHSLQAMLAATVCALLSGVRGCNSIADWVRAQEPKFWHLLGFFRKPPCGNTYRDALHQVLPETLEKLIRDWITAILGPVLEAELQALALDGKTLCGTLQPHIAAIHLLALLDHKTKCVLSQQAVDCKTNEHKAALELLKTLLLKGRLITGDAMFCQRDLCQQIVDSGGNYMFVVKDNQPELKAAISAEFEPHFSPDNRKAATSTAL